jgi:hypothetical protein
VLESRALLAIDIQILAQHTEHTSCETVTLVSTSLSMDQYNGTLRCKSSAWMSASSAIRSSCKGAHLFAELGSQSIVIDVAEIIHQLGLAQLRDRHEQVCEQCGSGRATIVFTRQRSQRERVEEIERRIVSAVGNTFELLCRHGSVHQ